MILLLGTGRIGREVAFCRLSNQGLGKGFKVILEGVGPCGNGKPIVGRFQVSRSRTPLLDE